MEKTESIKKRNDVNTKEGIRKYGDVEFADPKNHKYPISSEEKIRSAWNYINQAGNSAKYSSKDIKTIKSKIISAWKRKIDKNGPPSASKSGLDIGCPYCYDDEDTDNQEHTDYHVNQAKVNTEKANKILQNLYENNIDNELSKEEIMEYLEEIEHVFGETESFFKKSEK
jgi:glutaredoxin